MLSAGIFIRAQSLSRAGTTGGRRNLGYILVARGVGGLSRILATGNFLVLLLPLPSLLEDHLALGDIFTRTGSRALHNATRRCLAFESEYDPAGPSTGALNKFEVFGAAAAEATTIGPSTLSTNTASGLAIGLGTTNSGISGFELDNNNSEVFGADMGLPRIEPLEPLELELDFLEPGIIYIYYTKYIQNHINIGVYIYIFKYDFYDR